VSGGAGSFQLTGLAGCTWTASSNVSWLLLTSAASGTGPATVGYSAQANTGNPARSGTISIAGLTFTVNQAGACAYTLNPGSGSYPASGGSGTFTVGTSFGCAWTTASAAMWIHITSGQTGSGPGSVAFALDPNGGNARTGTITVADQTFTISQAGQGCSFTLSSTSLSLAASGGNGTLSVSAPAACAWTAATTNDWITIVTGASGSGSGVVAFSVSPNAGPSRTGTITAGGQVFTVTQDGISGIQISSSSVANAASYAQGGVSPGMNVVLFVPGVGPAVTVGTQLTPDGNFFTTTLGGVRVRFDGVAAPMVYAANGQFSAIAPYEVAGKQSTQLQVEFQGMLSNAVTIPVVATQPGLFSIDSSGSGPGAILDQQFQLNSVSNPAAIGSVVLLYATGEGQTTPSGVNGKLAVIPLPAPQAPVTVTIDGIDATVLYAGAAAGLVAGVMQVNVQIPDGVASGARPVILKVGQTESQAGVTVAIQ
jgi:uncharacterized protein (TIGR03437 family)